MERAGDEWVRAVWPGALGVRAWEGAGLEGGTGLWGPSGRRPATCGASARKGDDHSGWRRPVLDLGRQVCLGKGVGGGEGNGLVKGPGGPGGVWGGRNWVLQVDC